ncbi:MAG: hypothetical protein GEV04_25080, partial [Actinophytocola sp.]|nr:hypothetical protein [Actinophytocola sp.]
MMSPIATAATLAIYLAVLFLPGGVAGYAAGLRGWLLAGAAPLLSYAMAGLTGPWLAAIGVSFTLTSFALATAVLAGVAFGLGLLHRRRSGRRQAAAEQPGPWRTTAHIAVIGCVLAAAAIGLYTVLHGMGRLDAIPQDWDAAFHANGIRYLTETGDGSLTGMSGVNKYGD